MVLDLSEINCTLLKERLKSGQNCTENQPLRTPEGLISRTRLKNGRWTWNFGILHKSTWPLCVPILSEIGRPSFPSLPRSLRKKLIKEFIAEFDFYVALNKLVTLKSKKTIIKIFFKKQEKVGFRLHLSPDISSDIFS